MITEPPNDKPVQFPNQKAAVQAAEAKNAKSPWLLKIGRLAIAKSTKGNPAVMWANGYVKISPRIFWAHKIKKGDVVQIRSGWNDNATGCFAQVEEIILESAKLALPVPNNGGSQVLKMTQVPVGALLRVGRPNTKVYGQVRRNPERAQRKAKAAAKKKK